MKAMVQVACIAIAIFIGNADMHIRDSEDVAMTKAPHVFQEHSKLGTDWQEYTLTAYCGCEICCGKSDGITASGAVATQGRTIAVDVGRIPFGTMVEIEGMGCYIAEDCGGGIGGNRIDIYFDSHQDALNFGTQIRKVRIGGD